MSGLRLVIGSKNLSSWSLRPWFFLKQHGVAFQETVIELDQDQTEAEILQYSPSGRVPVLIDGDVKVWESLAICEYAADTFSLPHAWPRSHAARAYARAVAAEMHAGFAALRREMPFKAARRPEPLSVSAEARRDIARIRHIFREARIRYGQDGCWLFGEFGIADAMFAPVAVRLHTYAVALEGPDEAHVHTLLAAEPMQQWIAAAAAAGWPRNAAARANNAPPPAEGPEPQSVQPGEIRSKLLPP